ncbi:MAG: caspase family protein, partial [Verrucomicrobiae bacterium]|nr:caspase family protein [Verrucomicrobiae bacterium]
MKNGIALIVGINYYECFNPLSGCVNDAHAVKNVLERHYDGTVNFDCQLLTGTNSMIVTHRTLKDHIKKLFNTNSNIALF